MDQYIDLYESVHSNRYAYYRRIRELWATEHRHGGSPPIDELTVHLPRLSGEELLELGCGNHDRAVATARAGIDASASSSRVL